MALFGTTRDASLIKHLNRELIDRIIEQEVIYYKFSAEDTESNLYGESDKKFYYEPVLVTCLIKRGDQEPVEEDYGQDVKRDMVYGFLRDSLVQIELVPEKGDIVEWQNRFYEIHNVRENELFFGKSNEYYYNTHLEKHGLSISIVCDTHLTRREKLNIVETRL